MENVEKLENVEVVENEETTENEENIEVSNKKDRKIFLVLTLLFACIYLMLQASFLQEIDLTAFGMVFSELGTVDLLMSMMSLSNLFKSASAITEPIMLIARNFFLFGGMLFFLGHVFLNFKTKKSKIICLSATLTGAVLLLVYVGIGIVLAIEPALDILKTGIAEWVYIPLRELLANGGMNTSLIDFLYIEVYQKLIMGGLEGATQFFKFIYFAKIVIKFIILAVFMIDFVVTLFQTEIFISRKITLIVFVSLAILAYVLVYVLGIDIAWYKIGGDLPATIDNYARRLAQALNTNVEEIMPIEMRNVLIIFINSFVNSIKFSCSIFLLVICIILAFIYWVQTVKFTKQTKFKGFGVLLFILMILLFILWFVSQIVGMITTGIVLMIAFLAGITG